jgi:hypothetical protein
MSQYVQQPARVKFWPCPRRNRRIASNLMPLSVQAISVDNGTEKESREEINRKPPIALLLLVKRDRG